MANEIESKIKQEVARIFKTDPVKIARETLFEQDLNADSLSLVELIMSVESLFEMSIPDAVAVNTKTVGQLIDLVESSRPR